MCSTEVETAMLGISLYLPPVYERWQGALHYSVLIDDERLWRPSRSSCHRTPPGMSWVGKGNELVYTWCRGAGYEGYPDLYLDPGRHNIEIKAWLPGTDVVIAASTELELGCLVELDLYEFGDETD